MLIEQVTLVWTDYPGLPSAPTTLVNDLDLEVRSRQHLEALQLSAAGHRCWQPIVWEWCYKSDAWWEHRGGAGHSQQCGAGTQTLQAMVG